MSTIEQITISNCGPIKRALIPIPPGGGLVVLRGRNGVGKTTAIEHVDHTVSGRKFKGNVRDGEATGSVEAFGVTLKLGRSTRRSGELHVESLEGKFSISDLIDPGYVDAAVCDATRIKALVQIGNTLASAELFWPLVGGQEMFEKYVSKLAVESDDLVTMAERVKRDLQDAAKKQESQAEHAEGHANGSRQAAAGIDVSAVCDAKTLQAELNAAIAAESKLKAEKEAAIKAKHAAQLAADQLEDAEAAYTGQTLAQAIEAEDNARKVQSEAEVPVRKISAAIQTLKQEQAATDQALATCKRASVKANENEAACRTRANNAAATVRDLEEKLRLAKQYLQQMDESLALAETTAAVATSDLEEAAKASAEISREVTAAEAELQAANQANELACERVASCVAARKSAERHETTMGQWRAQVTAATVVEPSDEMLAAAAERVTKANAACDQGVLVRAAKEHLAEAERHVESASYHRKLAMQLRDAARGTDDILSEVIAKSGCQLRVEQARLVLDTRRGKTFFHELSAGERSRIAVDIGIESLPVGKPGVITLSQEIYEGLDPVNRDELAAHAKSRGVVILTAEASDDAEITPEVYEPANA